MSGSDDLGPSVGSCIAGRYNLLRQLGVGGMGTVYVAEDLRHGGRVALKVLAAQQTSDPARLERFRREVRAVAQLGHPNIIRALDAGIVDPHPAASGSARAFLAMELLDGEDLHMRLRREERLTAAEGISIACQVASGLAAAHAQGIVHRDLKPENVFLCRDGGVKVLDFGLAQVETTLPAARVTAQNALLGTPEYMSPEQAAGNPVDARSDIYALGCILYEMFTGHPPFTGRSFVAVLMAQLAEAPVPPHACSPPAGIPAALKAVILRALAKQPHERQASMAALETELRAVDPDGPPVSAAAVGAAPAPLLLAQVDPRTSTDDAPTRVFRMDSGETRASAVRPAAATDTIDEAQDGQQTHPVPRVSAVAQQLAERPDPLPRILDEIDAPRRRLIDGVIVLMVLALLGAAVGVALWALFS